MKTKYTDKDILRLVKTAIKNGDLNIHLIKKTRFDRECLVASNCFGDEFKQKNYLALTHYGKSWIDLTKGQHRVLDCKRRKTDFSKIDLDKINVQSKTITYNDNYKPMGDIVITLRNSHKLY